MPIKNIIILGAGPCGLSTAIALAKLSSSNSSSTPFHITLVEYRPSLQTIGGAINLTPLAMRYLDHLGAGERLRSRAISLDDGVDFVSQRTGRRFGNFWGGIGAIRTARFLLVESLLQTLTEEHSETVEVQWGKCVVEILEPEGEESVLLKFDDGATLRGDVLLGCDGINSAARRLFPIPPEIYSKRGNADSGYYKWVEPERQKVYIERVVAMGWLDGDNGGGKEPPMTLSTGEPALRDTAMFTSKDGLLLMTYYEPTRSKVYMAQIITMKESSDGMADGWKVIGDDKDALRRDIVQRHGEGRIKGLQEKIAKCQSWNIYPVYVLPPGGRWHRGRVLVMGDAAHAMVPQGESTGLAIEDGILIARVFERCRDRTAEQMFSDYEAVRKPVVDKHYSEADWMMKYGVGDRSWLMSVFLEWMAWIFLLYKKKGQQEHFAGDVRKIDLPA